MLHIANHKRQDPMHLFQMNDLLSNFFPKGRQVFDTKCVCFEQRKHFPNQCICLSHTTFHISHSFTGQRKIWRFLNMKAWWLNSKRGCQAHAFISVPLLVSLVDFVSDGKKRSTLFFLVVLLMSKTISYAFGNNIQSRKISY